MRRHPFFVDFMEIAGAQKKGIFAEVLLRGFWHYFRKTLATFMAGGNRRFTPEFAFRTRTLLPKINLPKIK